MPTKQEKVMRKEEALNLLREHFAETQRQFSVKRLALFGSTVRDEARLT